MLYVLIFFFFNWVNFIMWIVDVHSKFSMCFLHTLHNEGFLYTFGFDTMKTFSAPLHLRHWNVLRTSKWIHSYCCNNCKAYISQSLTFSVWESFHYVKYIITTCRKDSRNRKFSNNDKIWTSHKKIKAMLLYNFYTSI